MAAPGSVAGPGPLPGPGSAPESASAPGPVTRPVVVLGDLNVDLTLELPDRGAPAAERIVREPRLTGGGTAGNTAAALARLGVPVEFCGSVGDDGFGRWLADDLRACGVGTRGLVVTQDAVTCQVIAMVEPDGERYLVVWPTDGGALIRLSPADLDPGLIAGASWLQTTGMCLRQAPIASSVLAGMRLAREAGVPVSLDLSLRLELWGLSPEVLAVVTEVVSLADVVLGSGAEELVPLARTSGLAADGVEAAAASLAGDARTVVARLGGAERSRATDGAEGRWSRRRVMSLRGATPSGPATRSTAGSSRRAWRGCRSPTRSGGATPWARSRSRAAAGHGTSRHGTRCWH